MTPYVVVTFASWADAEADRPYTVASFATAAEAEAAENAADTPIVDRTTAGYVRSDAARRMLGLDCRCGHNAVTHSPSRGCYGYRCECQRGARDL
jgi:hypothetical protein